MDNKHMEKKNEKCNGMRKRRTVSRCMFSWNLRPTIDWMILWEFHRFFTASVWSFVRSLCFFFNTTTPCLHSQSTSYRRFIRKNRYDGSSEERKVKRMQRPTQRPVLLSLIPQTPHTLNIHIYWYTRSGESEAELTVSQHQALPPPPSLIHSESHDVVTGAKSARVRQCVRFYTCVGGDWIFWSSRSGKRGRSIGASGFGGWWHEKQEEEKRSRTHPENYPPTGHSWTGPFALSPVHSDTQVPIWSWHSVLFSFCWTRRCSSCCSYPPELWTWCMSGRVSQRVRDSLLFRRIEKREGTERWMRGYGRLWEPLVGAGTMACVCSCVCSQAERREARMRTTERKADLLQTQTLNESVPSQLQTPLSPHKCVNLSPPLSYKSWSSFRRCLRSLSSSGRSFSPPLLAKEKKRRSSKEAKKQRRRRKEEAKAMSCFLSPTSGAGHIHLHTMLAYDQQQ